MTTYTLDFSIVLLVWSSLVCHRGLVASATLEDRVSKLELTVAELEESLVEDYGLIKRCRTPTFEHGVASCNHLDLTPGKVCKALCDAGWIQTPGRGEARCEGGGRWSVDLSCELPLLVVAGGVKEDDTEKVNSLEVISVLESEGCDVSIPDMPGNRALHSLVYDTVTSPGLLVCNSIGDTQKTTCDHWAPGEEAWTIDHSSPHRDDNETLNTLWTMIDDDSLYRSNKKTKKVNFKKCGRYAASTLNIAGTVVMAGGMVSCNEAHTVTTSIRRLRNGTREIYWEGPAYNRNRDRDNMKTARAFFCLLNMMDTDFLAIGGYSLGKTILKSSEVHTMSRNWTQKFNLRKIDDMDVARSGHGCSLLTSDRSQIIVSGGSPGENQEAMTSSEVFSVSDNTWRPVGDMAEARFGHAIVKIGDRVLAVGGSRLHPDIMTDTVEEYEETSGWRLLEHVKMKIPRANFGYTLVPHSLFPGCTILSQN